MIQWVCKENLSFLLKDSIYYVDLIVSKYEDSDNVFTDYLEIYDLNEKYLGGFWIDINKYFIKLAEFRNNRINQILDETISED